MDKLFSAVLNMSLTGSLVILPVLLVRLLLKRFPKTATPERQRAGTKDARSTGLFSWEGRTGTSRPEGASEKAGTSPGRKETTVVPGVATRISGFNTFKNETGALRDRGHRSRNSTTDQRA